MQEFIQEFSNLLEMGTAAVLKLLADADVFSPNITYVIRIYVFKRIWVDIC